MGTYEAGQSYRQFNHWPNKWVNCQLMHQQRLFSLNMSSKQGSRLVFIIIGLWNTFFTFALFGVLTKFSDANFYALILAIVYFIGTIQSHFLYRRLVWKSIDKYVQELFRFSGMVIGLYFTNLLLLKTTYEILEWNLVLSQLIISAVMAVFSFLFQKNLVYRSKTIIS